MEKYDEPRYEPRPKSPEINIEGRVETALAEINPADSLTVPLPPTITWDDAQLRFERVDDYMMPLRFTMGEHIDLYTGFIDFVDRNSGINRTANISSLISSKVPVLYTGTQNGFYAHDPRVIGRCKKDYPFYVVGVQPGELEESQGKLSAVWHENGHIRIMHKGYDTRLFESAINYRDNLPKIQKIKIYLNNLDQIIQQSTRSALASTQITQQILHDSCNWDSQIDKAISLFHERNAWAGGAHITRHYGLPIGFQRNTSYAEYARFCLSTYAEGYHEDRFTNGWR